MGKRILVVDDAMFMRKMLSDILNNAGHESCWGSRKWQGCS